jgi:hypothetical protein
MHMPPGAAAAAAPQAAGMSTEQIQKVRARPLPVRVCARGIVPTLIKIGSFRALG